MHRITEHTENVIASIKDQQSIVGIGQDMLEGYRNEIHKIKSEKKSEEDLFSEKHEKQKDILKEISSKEEHTRLIMQKLEAREQIMRNLIVMLEEKRRKAEIELASAKKSRASFKDLKFSKGRLVWPVNGSVIKQFGNLYDPQLKITLYNPGIDIQAKTGDPVAAAAPGRVVAIEWKPGYGNFIILDHENGYYSIYAHLSKIMVGLKQVVPGGAQIAKAGATGSFEGPKLHFEIRKGGRALNPLKWLSS
jgi:murein DD-endopeptidase MepM/ murein hydrolase activator NlpD